MGDLNSPSRPGPGTEPVGDGEQAITALVPASELLRYPIELRSLTGGRGRFTAGHDHYDVVPTPPGRQDPPRPRSRGLINEGGGTELRVQTVQFWTVCAAHSLGG